MEILADDARGDLFDLDLKVERLSIAVELLKAKHEAATIREAEERQAAEVAEATAERDALAKEV